MQNTQKTDQLRELHGAMVDLVTLMNRPQRDVALLQEAGVTLDRALFPLLVGIERYGPISVGELADRAGRDHTTVSRQVAKLVEIGLVDSRPGARDRRVNEMSITAAGLKIAAALHGARKRMAEPILAKWSDKDLRTLTRLMRRFVDDLTTLPVKSDES